MNVGLSVFSGLGSATIPYLDAVSAPYESLWLPDHLQSNTQGVVEGWTLLSYCMARYPDKVVGHQVLCNEFRHPAVLAKMASSAQMLSGGRFVLGIGAGWHRAEAEAYGIPFHTTAERFDRLIEAVDMVRRLWEGGPVDYSGRHYRLQAAECLPKPEKLPPVMVGASGDHLGLQAVAAVADEWNHIFRDVDEYAAKQQTLERHCADLGRDASEIEHVMGTQVLIAESAAELRALAGSGRARSVDRNGIAGTPAQILDTLARAIEMGAKRLIVGFADSPSEDGARLFAEEVLPNLPT